MKRFISIITVLILLLGIPVFAYADGETLSGNTLVFPQKSGDSTVYTLTADTLKRYYNDPAVKYYYFSHGDTGVLTDKNNYYDFSLESVTFTVDSHLFKAEYTYVGGQKKELTDTALENRYTVNDTALAPNTKISFDEVSVKSGGVRDGVLTFKTNLLGKFETSVFEFADVKNSKMWYYRFINQAGALGIMSGVGENKFEPLKNITRAELCTMIVRATSHIVHYSLDSDIEFTDVVKGSWYHDYVMKCASLGIVYGVGDGKFAPTANATRQEIAAMTVRLLKLLNSYNGQKIPTVDKTELETLYKDHGDIMDFAKDSVLICNKLSVMVGDEGLFRPLSNITRAECATIFVKIFNATNV